MFDLKEYTHNRFNLLTGDWVLVSPHRMKRPWQGKEELLPQDELPAYDPACYLCPGNKRADGSVNPVYTAPFSFVNDFSALLSDTPAASYNDENLLLANTESGICKVICFSPEHHLTLARMQVPAIEKLIHLWQKEFLELSQNKSIRYIQIFENRGEIMGCSNPHPHGQIWSSSAIPLEVSKETTQQKKYYDQHHRSLLGDYLSLECRRKERLVLENESFVALVPFWAVWPFETMIISKRQVGHIAAFTQQEKHLLATMLKQLTAKYDNLFQVSFPYSAGMHQSPVNDGEHPEWHWHMHFYPPLLRSATVKKFMVGYEMLANPQRDITAEMAAEKLRSLSVTHYKEQNQ